ncbi:cell division protein ZapE [uncultured Amnibacterium sp.]|uniref:cell division protein ZapE n=1 Tax=uncultured Amnibacterium sp. TaxID=1631851 RepID=UPI0035CBF8EC
MDTVRSAGPVAPATIAGRMPEIDGRQIAASLVPPRQFTEATLDNYRPDPDYASQAEAVEAVRAFTADWTAKPGGLFKRGPKPPQRPGLYLDGGFGVGKTHLLAALWQLAPGRTYFGTFIEYTAMVGALGYAEAVRLLSGATLLAIDEFELDDPGDTMLMSRLLGDLVRGGTRFAATSNTPPGALGEGRFAAADFLREIQGLSDRFHTIRIEGLDYRRRAVEGAAFVAGDAAIDALPAEAGTTVDDFEALVAHLASVHPARYVGLVQGIRVAGIRNVAPLPGQAEALRFVALVDRLYDAQVHIVAGGLPLDRVFGDDMLAGGYRKKYLRATSRLIAMTAPSA